MIELKNVNKYYNLGKSTEVHALKNIDLKIDKGEYVSVMGVSGSGKSTLLHIIGCLDTVTDGIYILGKTDISKLGEKSLCEIRNDNIGFVLQDFGLISEKSVYENISYPLLFNPAVKFSDIRKKVEKTAEKAGISDLIKKKVSELSGGQKQRVAICRAIVNDSSIILADEPTAALDKNTAFGIMNVFDELNRAGKTVIIVTHDKDISARCRRTIELSDGVITSDTH